MKEESSGGDGFELVLSQCTGRTRDVGVFHPVVALKVQIETSGPRDLTRIATALGGENRAEAESVSVDICGEVLEVDPPHRLPGVGSNFWFTIVGELHRPTTAADRDLDGVRALIVATTGTSRDALRHQLTTCGGTCVVVPNTEQALAALRAETFDVFLADTQGLDGMALAREIRAQEATKSLPLVLVSTVARGNAELEKAGIDGLLSKPTKQAELFACVARVTGRLDVAVSLEAQEALESDAWGTRRHDSPEFRQSLKAVAGARVLLAEDHPVNRQVATTMLETLKCRVDVVVNGVQAVDAVQRERYDLVFLDCQMPKLDGFEATRQIRRLEQQGKVESTGGAERSGHLPIVALTAYTAPSDRARSVESGYG